MEVKVTRRQLAATLAGGAALLAQDKLAQNPPVQNTAPPLPKNPEEELKAARDLLHQNGDQLAKFELSMSTEPAFQFKA